MSDTASDSLKPTPARIECEHRIKEALPPILAEHVLRSFPNSEHLKAQHHQSSLTTYRTEGLNHVLDGLRSIIQFNSQNFGFCCGAQLLVDFYVTCGYESFVSEYFRLWCSSSQIPHYAIFVKYIYGEKWQWKHQWYGDLAKHGRLIREWRNPIYDNHLLLMYEFCNHEKYGEFLDDSIPIPRRIIIE